MMLSLAVGWIFNVIICTLPVLNISYFNYGNVIQSDACLYFNFSFGRAPGWEYTLVFFLMINLLVLIAVLAAYVGIVIKMMKSAAALKSMGSHSSAGDKKQATAVRSILVLLSSNILVWIAILLLYLMTISEVNLPKSVSR